VGKSVFVAGDHRAFIKSVTGGDIWPEISLTACCTNSKAQPRFSLRNLLATVRGRVLARKVNHIEFEIADEPSLHEAVSMVYPVAPTANQASAMK